MRKPLLALVVFAASATEAGVLPQTCPGGSPVGVATFNFTGAEQVFVVPTGVSAQLFIQAWGAQGSRGADNPNLSNGGQGGLGGYVEGYLTNTSPGQTLSIFVGGQGIPPSNGFNGGNQGGNINAGDGGGASDIRIGGSDITNRVLVAGGGGGGGSAGCQHASIDGGAGGAGGGGFGVNGVTSIAGGGGFGGNIGVVGAPGAAGVGCGGFLGTPGSAGNILLGGSGGNGQGCCCLAVSGGGGGGGGWIGGGGGGGGSAGTTGCTGNDKGAGGGGGGGQSERDPNQIGGFLANNGIWLGDGSVSISYCLSVGVFANSFE